MAFNSNKFKYVCFAPSETISYSNIYLCSKTNLIDKVKNRRPGLLGITMSSNCNFNQHTNNVYKQCSRLSGCIPKTFFSRDSRTLLTIFECIVLSRLDYGSQLWSPHQILNVAKNIASSICRNRSWWRVHLSKQVQSQRSFTKFITGMQPLSYDELWVKIISLLFCSMPISEIYYHLHLKYFGIHSTEPVSTNYMLFIW